MSELGSIRILGDGYISAGEYKNITIMGDARSIGSFKCEYLKVLGDCKLNEEAVIEDFKIVGTVVSEKMIIVDGTLEIIGDLTGKVDYKVNKLKATGIGTFKEDLEFEEIKVLGELNVNGDCQGNIFNSKGSVNIDGLLSADNIIINPRGISTINEIGGSEITIENRNLFTLRRGRVIINSIEGDKIRLENTECKNLHGHDITILGGCKIGKIEYTGSLTIDKDSVVGEVVCLKN